MFNKMSLYRVKKRIRISAVLWTKRISDTIKRKNPYSED